MSTVNVEDAALNFEEEGLFARDIDGRLVRLDEVTSDDFNKDITIKIDGQEVTVKKAVPATDSQGNILRDKEGAAIPRATTIFDAANKLYCKKPGDVNPIPILCHQEHMKPVAVCRMCVVEISKMKRGEIRRERKLLPACQHRVEPTMEVHTSESPDPAARERVRKPIQLLTEMLTADHLPKNDPKSTAPYNELNALAQRLEVSCSRFSGLPKDRGKDFTSKFIDVDHNACILCDRCVRACDDVKRNFVIGRTGKGYGTHIGFDLNNPMGESSCVRCGECMISCPTGALTLSEEVKAVRIADGAAGPLTPDELKKDPLFAGLSYKFLDWRADSVVRRHVKEGEVLCREGEHGSTAFILKKGKYKVFIQSNISHVRTRRSKSWFGFLGRITSELRRDEEDTREKSGADSRYIRNDGGAMLAYGNPVAVRTPEDLILGEMTCMNHYPRSATIVAMEEGEVLEIRRNVLYLLQRNKVSRDIFARVYKERVLANHLQSIPFIAHLDDAQKKECVDFLREKVDLIRVEPGQQIFAQGERADHFYMVRLGFVKVTQSYQGQSRVLDYLGPGRYFGETGVLSTASQELNEMLPVELRAGVRTATCAALDDVELVRIRGEHFRQLTEMFPRLRDKLIDDAKEMIRLNAATRQESGDRPLGKFLDQGLFNAQRLLVLDLEACTRCDECTKACSDSHGGVTRLIREGLRFDKFLVASSCRSCLDPYCLVGCPVDAIHRKQSLDGKNGLEIVIEDSCIGCELCSRNCPYGNINMHSFEDKKRAVIQKKATTCDLCTNVVSANEEVSCVHACPHNAAFRMSGPDLQALVEGRN